MERVKEMAETTYTAEDFMGAAEKLWPDKKKRPSRYLINAAFRVNGKTAVTKDEGIKMIEKFAGEKVS